MEDMIKANKIFFDMDGVLCDFVGKYQEYHPNQHPDDIADDILWANIRKIPNFWTSLELLTGAIELWEYAHSVCDDVQILSATSSSDTRSWGGKAEWLKRVLPSHKYRYATNLVKAKNKCVFAEGNQNHILIDDMQKNIKQFNNKGGTGIFCVSVHQALQDLKLLIGDKKRKKLRGDRIEQVRWMLRHNKNLTYIANHFSISIADVDKILKGIY